MADSKREQVRSMVERRAFRAIAGMTATMPNREQSEAVRQNMHALATVVAWEIGEEYSFLELADIMEWKRTRVRR